MIKKEMYIKCLKDLEKYVEWENKLAELGINIWENEHLTKIINDLTDLLSYCTKDKFKSDYDSSNIDYFIYDCCFGRNADKNYITEADGNIVKFQTANDLWNYLVKYNPDIEDLSES